MYMYIACTYMFTGMPVRNSVNLNMYIHVCTMYRDVCTDLPILVQVVRIPDVRAAGRPGPPAGRPTVTLSSGLEPRSAGWPEPGCPAAV
jgi:hypothetical protein